MDYKEAIDYLYSIPMFTKIGAGAYKPGSQRIEELDRFFDHPHKAYKTIHIAGTNGKGSSSAMIASVLMAAGYRVGLYTSPHLFDFRERIRVNGNMISQESVASFTKQVRSIVEGCSASFFEVTTAMAFKHFRDEKVDFAIIETGLGGRLDATNIISPVATLITNIGLDHTAILGDTIEQVAAEKGGIIKQGTPLVISEYNSQSTPLLVAIADELSAPYLIGTKEYKPLCVDNDSFVFEHEAAKQSYTSDQRGEYQLANIAGVISLFDIMRTEQIVSIDPSAIKEGLAATVRNSGLMGRWQTIQKEPLIVCDTGHNAHAMTHITKQLVKESGGNFIAILGFAQDKGIEDIFDMLPKSGSYIFTQADSPRSRDCNDLLDMAIARGLNAKSNTSVGAAISLAIKECEPGQMIFIGGSNFVVAEIDLTQLK